MKVNVKHTTTKRRKKENKTKAATRKRNRFQKNIQRVYNLCIKCPIPDLKEFLTYPPNVIVPKHFIDVESVSSELFIRDAQCVAHLLQQPYLSNGAASLVINNLPAKAQEKAFAVLYPKDCSNGGGDSNDGPNDEEEPNDNESNESGSEDESECEDNESEFEKDMDMNEN